VQTLTASRTSTLVSAAGDAAAAAAAAAAAFAAAAPGPMPNFAVDGGDGGRCGAAGGKLRMRWCTAARRRALTPVASWIWLSCQRLKFLSRVHGCVLGGVRGDLCAMQSSVSCASTLQTPCEQKISFEYPCALVGRGPLPPPSASARLAACSSERHSCSTTVMAAKLWVK
jgi:hypothetical protein